MSQMLYGVANSFCWAELFTQEKSTSKEFYKKLFGWNYTESPISAGGATYTHAMLEQGGVAGLMEIDDEMRQHGVVPYWNSYIAVKNLDETLHKAIENGATPVLPAVDVPNAGRMAMIKDPTGAHLSLWQSHGNNKPAPNDCHGMVGWNELLTHDVQRAQEFYTTVFGWDALKETMNDKTYISFTQKGRFVGGMMQITPDMGPIPPCWTIYFTTDNLTNSRRVAKEYGATEMSPVITLPGIGILLVIRDPEGAVFSLFEWEKKHHHHHGCC